MQIGKSSVPCDAAERRSLGLRAAGRALRSCAVVWVALALAGSASAQSPTLRLAGASAAEVKGTTVDGSAAFPARALEILGFRLAPSQAGFLAILASDTLRFWTTSPYFRAGGGIHQLTSSTVELAGIAYIPEQFFIQWLPNAFPDRFSFSSGRLSVRDAQTAGQQPEEPSPKPADRAAPGGTPASSSGAAPARAGRDQRPQPVPRVVVIDPGHGGRDPGRIGPNGLAEKDVTLMVAQRLAAVLRERGYEVHLTRENDRYVSLPERPKLANRWKGDRPVAVFLSIHANAAPSSAARGFETFFLSEARTDDERRVAEMENEAIHFDDHGPASAENGLDHILNTLRSDFLMRASHDLAAVLQEKLAGFHPGPNRGVKRAGFYVLVGAIMPAVLIETAFLSNREEAALLGTQSFRQKIALGIADGVDEFFSRNEHLWVQDP
jgi:N-acetylmuramoyl-L-alanine amidase